MRYTDRDLDVVIDRNTFVSSLTLAAKKLSGWDRLAIISLGSWAIAWRTAALKEHLNLQWCRDSDRMYRHTQIHMTLCDPMDCTVHGILQARILECVAIPFSRGPSHPTQGSNPGLPHCSRIFYHLSHQGSLWMWEWMSVKPWTNFRLFCPIAQSSLNWIMHIQEILFLLLLFKNDLCIYHIMTEIFIIVS